jgi:hypothetical protein
MRVLLAWEFGSNWGHLATLLPLAQGLRARGHEVVFAVRGLDGDLSLLTSAGFACLPMPIAIAPLQQLHNAPVRGYADVLARGGFADVRALTQLTLAWAGLLRYVSPDVVVCKYAPLAEFATRDRPVVSIGSGFELSPLTTPLPSWGALSVQDRQGLNDVEESICSAMNAACQGTDRESFGSVAAAFSHTSRFLLTWPELDHFGARPAELYLGGAEDLSESVKNYPALDSFLNDFKAPATFAYLRLGAVWLQTFLQAVQSQKAPRVIIVVDPTLTQDECSMLSGEHQIVISQPVNLNVVMPHVDTLICHSGHGMVVCALKHRKRLIMLPQYTEQTMLARRVIASQPNASGVALMIEPQSPTQLAHVHETILKMDLPQALPALRDNVIDELMDRIEGAVKGRSLQSR